MDNTTTATPQPSITLVMMAHIAGRGDVHAATGGWVGEPGSGLHIEGIAVSCRDGASTEAPTPTLEYQLVFFGDLRTPWTGSPHFCGSKGLSLACHGLRLRLAAESATLFDCLRRVLHRWDEAARGNRPALGPGAGWRFCRGHPAIAAAAPRVRPLGSARGSGCRGDAAAAGRGESVGRRDDPPSPVIAGFRVGSASDLEP
jgi:hypothetical protein